MKELHHPHQDDALQVLKESKVVAVVGISPDPERPSYYVTERLISKGLHKVYLINPKYAGEEILGHKVVSSLSEVPEPIDIVNVFRNPAHIGPIFEEALRVGAKCVWLQPGCENLEVIEKYKDKIGVVWNACIGVEAGYL
ncbi:CoA-binding protein [Hydrogenobacter sp. T-2]|uniref:CoA-binding protein n=1 Tax=Pampinifervens diazotrophicum TaxID=1632018 RepID=UPI002B26389A|nr:CoA-binding protein [Hydrogenobacter sp. T-2]WPM31395.1 CoA-binding protein [Hydrogenobacter sp. T-2]